MNFPKQGSFDQVPFRPKREIPTLLIRRAYHGQSDQIRENYQA